METEELPYVEISPGRLRFKTVDGYHIELLQMIVNMRIVETPVEDEGYYERFWCYSDLHTAVLAILTWDGKRETEPTGYTRRHPH